MTPSPAFIRALAEERTVEVVRLRLASTPDQAQEALARLADLAELEDRALDVPEIRSARG